MVTISRVFSENFSKIPLQLNAEETEQ